MKKISLKRSTPNLRNITNSIMILQAKHFICFDWTRCFYSDLLDRLRASYNLQQTGRKIFSRLFLSLFFSLFFFLSLLALYFCIVFFFWLRSRNAKDTEMKRVLPSTIRRPHRLPPLPQPDCSIFVPSWLSRSFVHSSFSLLSCSRNEEKRNSRSKSSRTLTLVGYYFYSVSSLSLLSGQRSFSSILSSSSRFVSSRLYRSRVRDQNWSQSLRYRDGILSWSTIFRIRSRIHFLVCRVSAQS